MLRTMMIGAAALFLSATACFALSQGSTVTPDQGKFSVGLEYNRVLEKDLSPKDSGTYDEMRVDGSNQVAVIPAYGAYQNDKFKVGVLGKLGAADLKTKGVDFASRTEKLDYDMGFLWGIGGQAVYTFEDDLVMALSVQFNEWYSDLSHASYNGQSANSFSERASATVSDFQAALLFSKSIKMPYRKDINYIPYIGPSFGTFNVDAGTVSYRTSNFSRTNIETGAEGDTGIGLIVGLDVLTVRDTLRINAELRLFMETALSLSAHYNF